MAIDAGEASSLATQFFDKAIKEILEKVQAAASKGNYSLFVYSNLPEAVRKELSKRNFKIIDYPSICVQKDSIHHKIIW